MDIMLSITLASPREICGLLADRLKAARLAKNLSQQGLAERSGVSYGSLRRFESTGNASLEMVARIALALELERGFEPLFEPPSFRSINEVLAEPLTRKRGTKK